uniref:Uncharacterized protein n=1 Tax=Anguilla anguilla TaxID=7936 RepID=A0A0E9P979_ANGAN
MLTSTRQQLYTCALEYMQKFGSVAQFTVQALQMEYSLG